MAFPLYLAMTAGELQNAETPPSRLCYMACHFSAYTTGLSNIPHQLPGKSILILNDRISIHGHDAQVVATQLTETANALEAEAILLDFQRPVSSDTQKITEAIIHAAAVPVAVTPPYAADFSCGVFVPSPPVNCRLENHIKPWKHREIWLEVSMDVQEITVTKDGSHSHLLPYWDAPERGHNNKDLHCHYKMEVTHEAATFTLWRTQEDLQDHLAEAEKLGIRRGVGLYQELRNFTSQISV